MTRGIETRLRNLERRKDDQEPVPVFCGSEAAFDAAFARKVKWGLFHESDRQRALPWTHERFAELRAARDDVVKRLIAGERRVPIPRFGTHEEWLYVSGIIP